MEKEKILIINGDEYVRNTLVDCLSKDYSVTTSPTFSQALKITKDKTFHVVITELETPEEKSIEVVRKFKELESNMTVIVVTTYDSVPLAVEAMKEGVYDYITKPFNFDELKLTIAHAIERQKLMAEVKEKHIYQELALLDGLTKIYNRRYFDELLGREVNRAIRYPQKFSLLMIDIDDFKKHNDAFGHLSGDHALKEIAQIIFNKARTTDFVARYGGEEFVVITPHTDKKSASVLAARILTLVNTHEFVLKNPSKNKMTVSIGIATFSDDAKTKEELIERADQALYQAKKLGKNRVCLFGIRE